MSKPKNKPIFSRKKYITRMARIDVMGEPWAEYEWPKDCNGMTAAEMNKSGYETTASWMITPRPAKRIKRS